jgi:hypothetical protein
MLVAVLLVGCKNPTEDTNEKKSFDISIMDLGMSLWKNKIQTFNGDIKKADSAYAIDKQILIDDIYKNAEKVEKKRTDDKKECGHIFFNKYCQSCKEYRLEHDGF